MSEIKSFAVGEGDMFYVNHGNDSFTIIDCCLDGDTDERILNEVDALRRLKSLTRFISTHPDEDHIGGLHLLDERIGIVNFYCVENKATKPDQTDSFDRYCELRDADKAFYLFQNCSRKWLNDSDDTRRSSGITIVWPVTGNADYQSALHAAAEGESPNNISPIIKYSLKDGANVLWMGDLETEFMESISDSLDLPAVDILFAPHHGRDTGKVPESMLTEMSPKIVVIGEAPSEHLNYYEGYDTITQNSAGDIVFDCVGAKVHVFCSNEYEVDFLDDENQARDGLCYVGTLNL